MRQILRLLVLAAAACIAWLVFFQRQHRHDDESRTFGKYWKSINAIPGSSMCSATPIRIACMGDSITRGDASHEKDKSVSEKPAFKGRGNYPKMLQAMLGPGFDVRNFGRGGATACNTSGAAYIDTPHYSEALKFKPHIAVIMLGTNDARKGLWEGRTKRGGRQAVRSGLEQIIAGIVDSYSTITVLVPPPPILIDGTFHLTRKFLPDIRDEVRAIDNKPATCDTIQYGSIVTPELPIPEVATMFMKDGIHLNHNGTARLACVVFNELMRYCRGGWSTCVSVMEKDWQAGEAQCGEFATFENGRGVSMSEHHLVAASSGVDAA